jgi:hypothetical protein
MTVVIPRSPDQRSAPPESGAPRAPDAAAPEEATPAAPDGRMPAGTGAGRARVRALVTTLSLVLGLHLATRAVTLGVLAWMAAARGVDPWPRLHKADGEWYLGLIGNGYQQWIQYRPDGSLVNTNLAFFPGYPMLSRAVGAVSGLPPFGAGLLVTAVAAAAASWLIYLIGRDLHGHRAGLMLVVLWSAGPASVVLSMVYTEALFTALAAGALLALMRRHWLTAGVVCALAGLTRSSGVAVAAAVAVVAVVAAVRREDGWRPYAALALAPLGVLGYWAWVGVVLGRPDGWFWMQHQGWGMGYDFGASTLRKAGEALSSDGQLVFTACALVLAGSIVLWLLMLGARTPLPLAGYATVMLVVTLGTAGYFHVEPRFLLPAFPLLLPLAALVARAPVRVLVVVLPALTLASAWYGSVLLVVWRGAL